MVMVGKTRETLSTSVSQTTMKRLRQVSKASGVPISRLIDMMTLDTYAEWEASHDTIQGSRFFKRLVDANLARKIEEEPEQ
jgi:hypothetical protein